MLRIVLAAGAMLLAAQSLAQSPRVSLKGHDPVAYFTEGRPVQGQSNLNYDYDEARYLFSSARNRELFASSPERYTPQFAGLCATGMGLGMKAEADPSVFRIVEGRLYVFSSVQAREKADKDPALLAKAQQNARAQR